jgi:hypothetical protein
VPWSLHSVPCQGSHAHMSWCSRCMSDQLAGQWLSAATNRCWRCDVLAYGLSH